MAENTNIEWATHTFSPWIGCQKVGPGCDHCYAEIWDEKSEGETRWGPHAARKRTRQGNWDRVITWNYKAGQAGIRESVFVASLADVFDTHRSIEPEWRSDLAALVRKCENLDFMFLTKRAGNVEKILKDMFPEGAPSNLFIGITVVNQEEADRDIVKLLRAKAACGFPVAFLSMEPLLGAVNLTALPLVIEDARIAFNPLSGAAKGVSEKHGTAELDAVQGIPTLDWVIVGGETGTPENSRPMHIHWVRGLRDQCAAAGTPFLFKQWGNWFPEREMDADGSINSVIVGEDTVPLHIWEAPEHGFSVYLDKKVAGRFLDGRTWDGVPVPVAEKAKSEARVLRVAKAIS